MGKENINKNHLREGRWAVGVDFIGNMGCEFRF